MAGKKINIALVDDHALFRRGIANLLLELADINIVFDVSNGVELQHALKIKPDIDVILMDINMPVMDGYQATQWVKAAYPLVHVLALSMFDEDTALIGMLKAGAGGYVLKESQPAELYRAITEIRAKGFYLNEMVSGKMLRSFQEKGSAPTTEIHLTPREIEFIKLCASELAYKEIADEMNVASRTVDNYRESVFEKLQVKTRVGLVLFAIRNKILEV